MKIHKTRMFKIQIVSFDKGNFKDHNKNLSRSVQAWVSRFLVTETQFSMYKYCKRTLLDIVSHSLAYIYVHILQRSPIWSCESPFSMYNYYKRTLLEAVSHSLVYRRVLHSLSWTSLTEGEWITMRTCIWVKIKF